MSVERYSLQVYRPRFGRLSFETWLFSALNPIHRRVLTAGLSVIAPAWGMGVPSAGFGRRRGPELIELRLRCDDRALKVRTRQSTVSGRTPANVLQSSPFRRREPGPVMLRAFFRCRGERIVVLSGGVDSLARPQESKGTPGLHEARWRLRELEAREGAERVAFGRLGDHGFEPISCEPHAGTIPGPNGDEPSCSQSPLLDFLAVHARVRREAKEEGRRAVAELHAMEDRFRLASGLIAHRRAAKLTQHRLATLAGVPQSEISRLESARSNPTIQTIGALARALGTEVCLRTL